jgi:FkbM family methyltransferase
MAFPNAKRILKIGSPLTSYKLLLMAASLSRPRYRALCLRLLRPFVKDGVVSVKYRCYGRYFRTLIRMSDWESDYMSTLELSVNDIYHIDRSFRPDLVIDGGGNIGLFTLRAAAALGKNGKQEVRFVICEPILRNIDQIENHLNINKVRAKILQVCLGGTSRTIPFYCREANQSSFESEKPYTDVMDIPVIPLKDAIGPDRAERILIKLDIEGMEVEALSTFVPSEQRPVYIVGELHSFAKNAPLMERLFMDHGWKLELHDIDFVYDTSAFTAWSPAALPGARIDSISKPALRAVTR